MYYLVKLCFICWDSGGKLIKLNNTSNGVTYYEKLLHCIPDLNISELQDLYMCRKCAEDLDIMYNFRLKCLSNTISIVNHLETLQTCSKQKGVLSVKVYNVVYDFIKVRRKNSSSPSNLRKNQIDRSKHVSAGASKNIGLSSQTEDNNVQNISLINNIKTEVVVDQNLNILTTQKINDDKQKCIVKIDLDDIFKQNDSKNALNVMPGVREIKQEIFSDDCISKTFNFDSDFSKTSKMTNLENFINNNETLTIPQNIDSEKIESNPYKCSCTNFIKNEIDFDNTGYSYESEYIVTNGEYKHLSSTKNDEISNLQRNTEEMHLNMSLNEDLNFKKSTDTNPSTREKLNLMPNEKTDCRNAYYKETELEEVHKNQIRQLLGEVHGSPVTLQGIISNDCKEKPSQCNKDTLVKIQSKNNSNLKFKCQICKQSYNQSSHLYRHALTHSEEKAYQCSICQKQFSRKDVHDKHKKLHDPNNLPLECKDCGKRFSQKWDLQTHKLIHDGLKPYECFICGRKFNRKGNMMYHINVKHENVVYNCSICSRSFNREIDLNKHGLMHTGEVFYECSFCSKIFNREDNLRCHMKAHSENRNDE